MGCGRRFAPTAPTGSGRACGGALRSQAGASRKQPDITVTWKRLDQQAASIVVSPGTNAFTAEDGDFIIAGIDPDEAGCWQVTATYKGTTLSYVYARTP